jgi:hypothetical protein
MSEVQAPVSQEREITIYATRGGQMKKITTSATTWGELQPLVRREGFDLSSLLAAENITKTDLVNDLAVLPTTAFRLFLRPKQTKSGAYNRKECFEVIKIHLLNHPEDKANFSINGRNVTQLPTGTVQELVAKYCQKGEIASSSVTTTASTTVTEKIVYKTAENNTDSQKVQAAINLISSLEGYDSYYKAHKHLDRLLDEVSIPEAPEGESEEEAIAREARELGY